MTRTIKQMDCPNGCGRACFHADWLRDVATPVAVWACGNCGTTAPRRIRRTKAQLALAYLRSKA